MIMFLEEKVFHVYVILDDFGLYFMSSDTGTKKLFVSISNPYYKILLDEKFGKFTDNKNDELYKNIIYALVFMIFKLIFIFSRSRRIFILF